MRSGVAVGRFLKPRGTWLEYRCLNCSPGNYLANLDLYPESDTDVIKLRSDTDKADIDLFYG